MRPDGKIRDIVLLHGWGTTAGVWKDLTVRLALQFRVHTPQLPGYGTGAACSPCTPEALARLVAPQAPPRCGVVGWSTGALVALAWARAAPQQASRLVLIAGTPCFSRRDDWPHAIEDTVFKAFVRSVAIDRSVALRRFIALQARGDERPAQVTRKLRLALAGGEPSREALKTGLAMLADTDLRGQLHELTQPSLVLHGDRDAVVPLAAGEAMSRMLPAARLEISRGAAHAPFLSNPAGTASVLRDFFS